LLPWYLYKYNQFPNSHSIPLFELHPGRFGEEIKGRLIIVDITDATPYEALSYVWGDPDNTLPITCDGKKLPITVNLSDALRKVRHVDQNRIVWADAICINQKDLQERSLQVRMMDGIYKRAKNVLAWLGPDHDGDAEGAFSLIQKFNKIYSERSAKYSRLLEMPQMLLSDIDPG
jgi:Heterokaryon incompatibility protein (HET)